MSEPTPDFTRGRKDKEDNPPEEIIVAEAIADWYEQPGYTSYTGDGRRPMRAPASAEPTYHVPKRFGMSAMLGITTALALLFGLLRRLGAPEIVYLFFGSLAMVICIAQMRYGDVPRQASVISGAVMLPVFLIAYAMFVPMPRMGEEFACLVFGSLPVGALFGYLTGTCAGGVFLLMDLFEQYWTRHSAAPRLDAPIKHG
jgi:hypothetical protein